jgi:hypothetical protein
MRESFSFYTNSNIVEILFNEVKNQKNIDFKKAYYKYLYIINYILFFRNTYNIDESFKGVPVNVDLLSDILGVPNSSKFLKNLRTWKLIEKVGNYVQGVHANYYDLNPQYRDDELLIVEVNRTEYPSFIDKLNSGLELSLTGIAKKLHQIMVANVALNDEGLSHLATALKVKPEELKFQNSLIKKEIIFEGHTIGKGFSIERNNLKLLNIYLGNFYTVRPIPGSRIYSNLTSLKREHRKFISFNGSPLYMTDISCSQVLLSVEVILRQYSITSGAGRINIPEDIFNYKKLAEQGLFYDFLIQFSDYTITIPKQRTDFKKQFFIDVFFSKVANWTTYIKSAFEEYFPTVLQLINQIKKPGHGQFAVELQKFEASIIIDKAAKELIKRKKNVLTLHDAIIADSLETLSEAEEIITQELSKLKTPLKPHFKRDNGKTISDIYVKQEIGKLDLDGQKVEIYNFNLFLKHLGHLTQDELRSVLYNLVTYPEGRTLLPIIDRDYEFVTKRGKPYKVWYYDFGIENDGVEVDEDNIKRYED